jgi:hypothetical protein
LEARLQNYLKEDLQGAFSISEAPLMRFSLLKLGDEEFYFLWTFHHILLDGWSLSLLLNGVFQHYRSKLQGAHPMAGDTRPYRQYIEWLQSRSKEEAMDFWRKRLQGIRSAPVFKKPQSHHSSLTFAREAKTFSRELSARLNGFCREKRLTLNTVIQGAWASILHAIFSAEEAVFGSTVSGRPPSLAGIERMIGLFINTLPVRVPVDGESEVLIWLAKLQQEQSEALEYEFSPLPEIQRLCNLPEGTALFESILVFENFPVSNSLEQDMLKSGIRIRDAHLVEAQSNYPLTTVVALGESLSMHVSYRADWFSAAEIRELFHYYEVFISSLLNDSAIGLSEMRGRLKRSQSDLGKKRRLERRRLTQKDLRAARARELKIDKKGAL